MQLRNLGMLLILTLGLAGGFSVTAQAQSEVINGVRISIKTGSSKELVKFFNDQVVLNIDGVKNTYSRAQAEFVLRDFFEKNPPEDNGFQYVHQGSSRDSLKYAIGKYFSSNGTSYKVVLLVKPFDGTYRVDTLDFIRE